MRRGYKDRYDDSGCGMFKELDGALCNMRTARSSYRGPYSLILSKGCEKPLKGFRQGVYLCSRKAALTTVWISIGGRARMKQERISLINCMPIKLKLKKSV